LKKKKIKKITLTESGFCIYHNGLICSFNWEEIDTLTGFKIDRFTVDDICIKVKSRNKVVIANEEFDGWRRFIDELLNNFPGIDKSWELIIAQPQFERNETVLLDEKKVG
jgi:hypothetical protein